MSFGKGAAQTPNFNPGTAAQGSQAGGQQSAQQWQQLAQKDANNPFQLYTDAQAFGNQQQTSPYQAAAGSDSRQSHVGLQGQFGSSGWSQDPSTGQWTQSQQLNGPLSGVASGLEGQIGSQSPLSASTGQGALQQAENASYNQATSRLDPQYAQGQESLSAQLAAQGLDPGSQAGQNAQGNFDRAKTDAYQTAQNNSVTQGLAAENQMFGQQAQANQQPYQQLQGLQGLLGNAQGVGSAQSPDYLSALGMQGNFNLGQANQQNQLLGGALQGAGSAAGAAYALSDERAKMRIRYLTDEAASGIPWVEFEYKHDPGSKRIGVIAQDVKKVRPDLVRERSDGLFEVNYGGLR